MKSLELPSSENCAAKVRFRVSGFRVTRSQATQPTGLWSHLLSFEDVGSGFFGQCFWAGDPTADVELLFVGDFCVF